MNEFYEGFEVAHYSGCFVATNYQEQFSAERLADIYEQINNYNHV